MRLNWQLSLILIDGRLQFFYTFFFKNYTFARDCFWCGWGTGIGREDFDAGGGGGGVVLVVADSETVRRREKVREGLWPGLPLWAQPPLPTPNCFLFWTPESGATLSDSDERRCRAIPGITPRAAF